MGILIEVDFMRETRRELIDIFTDYIHSYYELLMSDALEKYEDNYIPWEVSEAADLLDELQKEENYWQQIGKRYKIKVEGRFDNV